MDADVLYVQSVEQTREDIKASMLRQGDMIIATRVFPSETYSYLYSKAKIMAAAASLENDGYIVDYSTKMDSQQSSIVLSVRHASAQKEVKAEKL